MWFLTLLVAMRLSPSQACEGSPNSKEEYRDYKPQFVDSWRGPQIVAPDTPYVAATGSHGLYFLDSCLDRDTAKHINEQIERGTTTAGSPDEAIFIDELEGTAEVRNGMTGETVFVFDPAYARILFAKGMNRRNPALRLPEPEPAGDWLVTYDDGAALKKTDYFPLSE